MVPRSRKTICLDCTFPKPHAGKGRCAECLEKLKRKRERERSRTRQQPWYDSEWRELSRTKIDAHVRKYGYVCPFCDRAHPHANPLTLDHVKERSLEQGTQVMCRSCNSTKGARHGNAKRKNHGQ